MVIMSITEHSLSIHCRLLNSLRYINSVFDLSSPIDVGVIGFRSYRKAEFLIIVVKDSFGIVREISAKS